MPPPKLFHVEQFGVTSSDPSPLVVNAFHAPCCALPPTGLPVGRLFHVEQFPFSSQNPRIPHNSQDLFPRFADNRWYHQQAQRTRTSPQSHKWLESLP